MKKQELPEWFDGELCEEGRVVQNKHGDDKFELTNVESTMYDFVCSTLAIIGMGIGGAKESEDMHKGMEWFKKNNHDAYLFVNNYLQSFDHFKY